MWSQTIVFKSSNFGMHLVWKMLLKVALSLRFLNFIVISDVIPITSSNFEILYGITIADITSTFKLID